MPQYLWVSRTLIPKKFSSVIPWVFKGCQKWLRAKHRQIQNHTYWWSYIQSSQAGLVFLHQCHWHTEQHCYSTPVLLAKSWRLQKSLALKCFPSLILFITNFSCTKRCIIHIPWRPCCMHNARISVIFTITHEEHCNIVNGIKNSGSFDMQKIWRAVNWVSNVTWISMYLLFSLIITKPRQAIVGLLWS